MVHFFTDRSLGDHMVPAALRSAGWSVVTMRERYGAIDAQALADIDWIRDASAHGEVLLTGDRAIARRPLEVLAVRRAGARVFALANNQLSGPEKAERFLSNEQSIMERIRTDPGPFVIALTGRGLVSLAVT